MKWLVRFLFLTFAGLWCYTVGYHNGWEGYKHSRQMQFALDSAYQYGADDELFNKRHGRIK